LQRWRPDNNCLNRLPIRTDGSALQILRQDSLKGRPRRASVSFTSVARGAAQRRAAPIVNSGRDWPKVRSRKSCARESMRGRPAMVDPGDSRDDFGPAKIGPAFTFPFGPIRSNAATDRGDAAHDDVRFTSKEEPRPDFDTPPNRH